MSYPILLIVADLTRLKGYKAESIVSIREAQSSAQISFNLYLREYGIVLDYL
jgi:hypothetical protein